MRSSRRRSLLVPVLLCALAALAARPADSPDKGGGTGLGAKVLRLYEDAARAAQRYEDGRREAEARRSKALEYRKLLDRQRQKTDSLHEELGRVARAQYRGDGEPPLTERLVLADDSQELMRGPEAAAPVDPAVKKAIGESLRAEARLAAEEAEAQAAWQALEERNAGLAERKKKIEGKLHAARSRLEEKAEASVAAGSCPVADRLDQPDVRAGRSWVAPVETYKLSAPFGRAGTRWANRHTGQDFAVPVGTPVRSVGTGRVVKVACGGAFGIQVVVRHAGGYYTQYAHLAALAVGQGDRVGAGQWIGQSGSTGNSTGPHLHFEVRTTPQTGSALDPVPWLSQRGVPL
ncbi:M23 family metallopeptidase [Streptomyces lancefieldiae]|uniref:M23 family metallopeptidase n=1 Tax=Streptomyces lancefieldiae TaxID=3075520 RepID=A0ABU3AHT2_9ACTN|nr:M23 family metallopeptidase [Streptomyces sp. DSM 40712]MDT0609747.1 M23 family metallopeptidase [Streptomyces sp. DSM 40712]